MKRWRTGFAILMVVASGALGAYDISFTTNDGGSWSYDGTDDIFTFHQLVGVDLVQGATVDNLVNTYVYIPELKLSGITGFLETVVTPYGPVTLSGVAAIATPEEPADIVLKDAGGAVVLKGSLGLGQFVAYGTTAGLFPSIQVDIVIDEISATYQSAFLGTLEVGDVMDFSLSLQGDVDMAAMVEGGVDVSGNTFSGGMNVIPEPATLALLGLGGLLLRKRARVR